MQTIPSSASTPSLARRLRVLALAAALAPVAVLCVVLAVLMATGTAPFSGQEGTARAMLVAAVAAAAAGIALALALPRWLAAKDGAPVAHKTQGLQKHDACDLGGRAGLRSPDEIGALALALDALLDRRIGGLERVARESEELNDSVIEIMQAVGTIATRKDLTIRVPVTENVTGAIADALNLLTDETRRVLLSVRGVSQDVARATMAVKTQSDTASRAAAREQREVEFAARELAAAAVALNAIATRARASDEAAARTLEAALAAVQAVDVTGQGLGQSRALIRETEKRIKRLGERSQEIGQVVGIIRDIAERTGILALNASMRAAAAGPGAASRWWPTRSSDCRSRPARPPCRSARWSARSRARPATPCWR